VRQGREENLRGGKREKDVPPICPDIHRLHGGIKEGRGRKEDQEKKQEGRRKRLGRRGRQENKKMPPCAFNNTRDVFCKGGGKGREGKKVKKKEGNIESQLHLTGFLSEKGGERKKTNRKKKKGNGRKAKLCGPFAGAADRLLLNASICRRRKEGGGKKREKGEKKGGMPTTSHRKFKHQSLVSAPDSRRRKKTKGKKKKKKKGEKGKR